MAMKLRDRPVINRVKPPNLRNEYFEIGEEVEIKGKTFVVRKVSNIAVTFHLKKTPKPKPAPSTTTTT